GSEGMDPGAMLIHRVLARIQQKTKQLTDYADAVVLSISIPRADLRGERTVRSEVLWLDLKALAGSVTLLLTKLRMLSAVMISLWDVEPMPAQAGTRLANVELVERSKQQRGFPRVRILIQNPAATAPLTERQQEGFCQLL
ncbi:MAG TPA: hypothetical protein VFO36_11190, partial [Nitrospiraceae bacterium]|nr:hypothetical protein [Nitrospiraceae bacterium]